MPVYRLRADLAFPPPAHAEPSGLLAVGGDLSSERLLLAYSLGIFPWYEKPPILWFSPGSAHGDRAGRAARGAAPAARAAPGRASSCASTPPSRG